MTAILETAPLEKTPLERYVPPAKPSLVGLTRAALAEALGAIGVAPSQQKMRVQQLWHWIYVRGAQSFEQMTSVSKELHAVLDAHYTLARPEVVAEQVSVDGTRKWLLRLPGEVEGERPHEVECVYIPESDRGTLVRVEPGRLHAELLVLPHRHAAAGPQSDARRDRRPGHGGARPARRLPRHGARARRRRADRRRPLHLQHRDDGDGRAALQFRGGARRARRGAGRRRAGDLAAAHHAVDLRRGADDRAGRRRDRRHAGDLAARGARRAPRQARAAQPEISDRAIARGLPQLSRACRTRGASPSNT